ncbi:hypothetical protein, partial [Gilliamella sp. W8123]|uniref:hypothetical protein n=1 Tax=Gilliamella sp. W8123 TaxID=2750992 RepID=UPI001E32A3C9
MLTFVKKNVILCFNYLLKTNFGETLGGVGFKNLVPQIFWLLVDFITDVSDLLAGFWPQKPLSSKFFSSLFFGCLSFGRLLFCGCFYTVITSELRGLA